MTSDAEPSGDGDGRASSRREAILAAAAELFSTNGYPATGVDEIGQAVGITGPGVYRHFENKADVLATVIRRAVEPLAARVAGIVSEPRPPDETLAALVDNLVSSVVSDPEAYAVMAQEQHHLDDHTLRALRRAHRLHVEEWVHALQQLHPDLSDGEARTITHGVLGLLTTVPGTEFRGTGVHTAALLASMAMIILLEAGDVAGAAGRAR